MRPTKQNYRRDALMQFKKNMHAMNCAERPSDDVFCTLINNDIDGLFAAAAGVLENSERFIVPDHGLVCPDREFIAIGMSPIHLPFSAISVEFDAPEESAERHMSDNEVACSKRVAVAKELSESSGPYTANVLRQLGWTRAIYIQPVPHQDDLGSWLPYNPILLDADRPFHDLNDRNGTIRVSPFIKHEGAQIVLKDAGDELRAVLSLLNFLACSNVVCERVNPIGKKSAKSGKVGDCYYVLKVVNKTSDIASSVSIGNRISPREHLRRGHMRKCNSGKVVWVNAAVVNAGRGHGKISKDYKVGL